ncbi:MAG: ABC transporter ATP-binding protein [Alphaproteobacteria bacterium]
MPEPDSRSPPLLQVSGLSKNFGGLAALADVDLEVAKGEFRAIIGPNGAGKSTFFNTLTGLYKADAGSVRLDGRDITGRSPHALARAGVSRTFQITAVFSALSAQENVQMALLAHMRKSWDLFGVARKFGVERAKELLAMVELPADAAERAAGTLSHGDQKRLELAIALASEPKLLLLDEPTAGMAAQERLDSIGLVHRVAHEIGLTVVFTEHDMAVVFAVATQISVLHQGRILAAGTPEAVRANEDVRKVYLGESIDA